MLVDYCKSRPPCIFLPNGHLSLKVPNVELDFDVSVRHCLLSTHTSKSNSILGTHLHAMIRTHHFDFDVRFWPISVENLTANINLLFHTFSGMCLWPEKISWLCRDSNQVQLGEKLELYQCAMSSPMLTWVIYLERMRRLTQGHSTRTKKSSLQTFFGCKNWLFPSLGIKLILSQSLYDDKD